ncbi:Universal stress protein [Roseimaritima multifibrata]|uniref:Universal stress protein n=1 Tax=Roseimaritima multifibrata TaxID=1930274 RepID=A0A517MI99_9BACT|nr:universal stress protein [Roseimaritima multifibrata]QDS94605.1 Universal stress protein [Roseimaritima multifibrata]
MAETNYFAKTKIVVPFDFSDFSAGAVETACKIASRNEQVTVLHVIDPAQLHGFDDNGGYELAGELGNSLANIEGANEIDEANRKKALQAMQDLFEKSDCVGVHFAAVVDAPTIGIVEFASQNGVELIVMPSHGRTGIKRLLIGSVAEHVVRSAHCPVLVLR